MTQPRAATRGRPSYVWGPGQERRLSMIRRYVDLETAVGLDIGCGIGTYMSRLEDCGASMLGLDVDWPRVAEARSRGMPVVAASAERLPIEPECLDFVLLNEVLEHVADDGETLGEVIRVLTPGGRAIVFVPNRWWPFETHGVMWRGRYLFGNAPLVNYLPDPLRGRLAPHVRVYTAGTLRELTADLPVRVVELTQVFPGYDKLVARNPVVGKLARKLSYFLESTPARRLGLSHLLVIERLTDHDLR